MITRILGTLTELIDDATRKELNKSTYLAADFRDTIRLFLPVGHSLIGDEFVSIGIADNDVPQARATISKAVTEAVEHLPAMNYLHSLH